MKIIQIQILVNLNPLIQVRLLKKKLKLNVGEVREPEYKKFMNFYALLIEDSPTTSEDAMKSLDSPFWKGTIDNEIQFIVQNHT